MPKSPKVQYEKEALQKAIDEVKKDTKLSIRQIAIKYGVPRSSLRHRINNPGNRTSLGPAPILSTSEEALLEKWIIDSAKKGFPRSKDDILNCVQQFLIDNPRPNNFTNNRPGESWWKGFLRRHDTLNMSSSEEVTSSASYVTEKDIKDWFSEIENYAQKNNLTHIFNQPCRIFNAELVSFPISATTGQVLAENDPKICFEKHSKEFITVLFTFSATGDMCCPFIVYPYERLPERICNSVSNGWGIGKSDSGHMTSEEFYEYIANIFHPYLIENKVEFPVILFVDNEKTTINFHLSRLCTRLKIELIALYPCVTRLIQRSDRAVLRPLKVDWRKQLKNWQNDHEYQILTKENFAQVLKEVVANITPKVLVNGFKYCGLYPFDFNTISYYKCFGKSSPKITESIDPPDSATITYAVFSSIVGESMIEDLKNRHQNVKHETTNSYFEILYKIFQAFHDNQNNIDFSKYSQDYSDNCHDSRVKIEDVTLMDGEVDISQVMETAIEIIKNFSSKFDVNNSVLHLNSSIPETKELQFESMRTYDLDFKMQAEQSRMPTAVPKKVKHSKTSRYRGKCQAKRHKKEIPLKVINKKKDVKRNTANTYNQFKDTEQNIIKLNDNIIKEKIDSSYIDNVMAIEDDDYESMSILNNVDMSVNIPESKKMEIPSEDNLSNTIKMNCAVCQDRILKSDKLLICNCCLKNYHLQCVPKNCTRNISNFSNKRLFLCHFCNDNETDSDCTIIEL